MFRRGSPYRDAVRDSEGSGRSSCRIEGRLSGFHICGRQGCRIYICPILRDFGFCRAGEKWARILSASSRAAGTGTYQASFSFTANDIPTNPAFNGSIPSVSVSKAKKSCSFKNRPNSILFPLYQQDNRCEE
mgnify:CR=1 FL=1